MEILAALFVDGIEARPVAGPSTRLDLTGVQFSIAAPTPVPLTIEPHLCVIVHCPPGAKDTAALKVSYTREGVEIARNVQPLTVEPGMFNYRLVRAQLEFDAYDTIEAHCQLDLGHETVVPFSLLPPVD